MVAVGGGGHTYAIWLADTAEGKVLAIQTGEHWQRGRRSMGRLSLLLDNRNLQLRYVLLNGRVVPDRVMPKDGALMRGEWKISALPRNGVGYMHDVLRRLLSGIEL